jgi:hypothetical protein
MYRRKTKTIGTKSRNIKRSRTDNTNGTTTHSTSVGNRNSRLTQSTNSKGVTKTQITRRLAGGWVERKTVAISRPINYNKKKRKTKKQRKAERQFWLWFWAFIIFWALLIGE